MNELKIERNTDLNVVFKNIETANSVVVKNEKLESYQPQIRKAISANQILSRLLKLIEPIDFQAFLNIKSDLTDKDKSSKFDLDDEEKSVVILENLLMKADEISLGLIMDNYSAYIFNGGYWEEVNLKLLKTFLSEVAIRSGFPMLKARKKRINEMFFNQFTLTASSYINKNDNDVVKINLLNGTYHINSNGSGKGNVLKSANKEDYFKYQLPFEFNPDSKAPEFERFLNDVLPDKGCQNVLLEYIAYALTRQLKLEKVLILYGTGSNGKSAFFEIITALLGATNVSTIDMRKICDESGYYRVGLDAKLLNYASEFGGKIDNQMFKKLISGEPVEARHPNKEPIIIKDYCKFMFNANKLPEVEHTDAFFRRPIILPFTTKIDKSIMDIHLPKRIIKNELSGIFNLVLDGLERLLRQDGFSESELINNELAKFKKENNSVAMFLEEEHWIASKTQKIRLIDLYPFYERYCRESGQISFSRKNFSKRLKELDFIIEPGTNNYYYVWIEKDTSNEEKDPFSTFLKPDDSDAVDVILNDK